MVQHRERWMRTAWEIDYVQSSIKDARRSGAKMGHDAAGAQRKSRGLRLAGARSCAVGHPLHRLGGFCHHGDGGKGPRRQHPARPGLAAHPAQNRNPLLQQPYYHPIDLAMKKQAHPTPAVQKFIEYLPSQEVAK